MRHGPYASLDSSGKLSALNDLLRTAGIYREEMTAADNDPSTLYDPDPEAPPEDTESAKIDSPSKCLLFAQFSRSLDAVEEFLLRPHMPSLRYLRLDGRVPANDRQDVVDRFNSDPSAKLLLCTTKTGGLGLNLAAADVVVFLEHDWNPQADLQAMDRAHRIGQTKNVRVYRLITAGTIEEKVIGIQNVKLAMTRAIVNSDNSAMCTMNTEELLDLFTFRNADDGAGDKNCVDSRGKDKVHIGLDELYSEQEYCSFNVGNFLERSIPRQEDET